MVARRELRHWPFKRKRQIYTRPAACSKVLTTIAFLISQKFLQICLGRVSQPGLVLNNLGQACPKFTQLHTKGDKLICPNKNHKYKMLKKQRGREGTPGQFSTVSKFWFLAYSLDGLKVTWAQPCISWEEFTLRTYSSLTVLHKHE